MANLTQVSPGGVERPDVALKEDLDAVVQTANDAKTQAQETADFLETRVPIGRTINSLPLDQDIVITADDLDTYDKETIDAKLASLEAGGYNPVHINGHLLDKDVILSAGDIGAYSSSEVDNKVAGLVPASRTINGEALSADVVLSAGDVGAYTKEESDSQLGGLVPETRTINGLLLSDNITLQPSDIGSPKTADVVPRTFKINGQALQGDSLTITAGDSYTRTEIDNKLSAYLPIQNEYGLGLEPESVTDGSFNANVQGSGFYEYAAGTGEDADGNPIATSVSDRPTGSNSGRVVILTNAATFDANGNVTTPAVQDLLAFPNDLEGLWIKKNGQTWQQLGASGAGDLPFPHVWAPLSDTVAITAGSAPYDTITIGTDTVDLNSKSVTFTRASIATYLDNALVLQSADTDEARFERPGLLVEGPATNAVVPSSDMTYWATTGSTANYNLVGPDNVASMGTAKFQVADGTKTVPVMISTTAANSILTAGSPITVSIFAKAAEQSIIQLSVDTNVSTLYGNFDLNSKQTGGTASNLTITTLANGWVRCSMTVTNVTVPASGTYFAIYAAIVGSLVATRQASFNAPTNNGLYVFGAQIEAGSLLTSYIPTSSAPVTRAADMVSMRGAQNWNAGAFTVSAQVHTNWDATTPNDAPRVFDLGGAGNAGKDYASLALGPTKQVTGLIGDSTAGATVYTAVKAFTGKSLVVALRYDGSNLDLAVNGVLTAKTAVPYVIGNTSTTLRIGGQTSVGTRHLYGHIRNLRVWHRALKDSEVKGLQ